MTRGFLIVLLVTASGCAAIRQAAIDRRQDASSGFIGCPPGEIQIADMNDAGTAWTAICQGRRFYCSGADGTAARGVACAPALSPGGEAR